MYLDDLPVWGMVGETHSSPSASVTSFIFTKRHISLSYNQDRIIEVNMTSDGLEPVVEGHDLTFSLTVSWKPTDAAFHNRFERYLDNEFFEHTIHWFSIFNSFMMVIFLVGLVALILVRALKKDYQKYGSQDKDLENMVEDSGWKQVHGDVFRPPK